MHRTNNGGRIVWGIILILLGLIFLLQNLGYWEIGDLIRRFWPVIFILIGLKILLNHHWRFHSAPSAGSTSDVSGLKEEDSGKSSEERYSNVFGDLRMRFDDKTIQSAHFSNVLGDTELDFSRAKFEKDAALRVNGVLGDVEIRLPAGIEVETHTNCLAGSIRIFDQYQSGFMKNVQYSSPSTSGKSPLRLHVSVLFGDIKIYS